MKPMAQLAPGYMPATRASGVGKFVPTGEISRITIRNLVWACRMSLWGCSKIFWLGWIVEYHASRVHRSFTKPSDGVYFLRNVLKLKRSNLAAVPAAIAG